MSCLSIFQKGITAVDVTGPSNEINLLGSGDNCPGLLTSPWFSLVEIYLRHVCTLVGLFISQWSTTRLQYKCAVLRRLTLTAAFCGTLVENVAFRLKSLPTHALTHTCLVSCLQRETANKIDGSQSTGAKHPWYSLTHTDMESD